MRNLIRSLLILIPTLASAQWEVPVRIEMNGATADDRQVRGLADPVSVDAAISVDAVRSGVTTTVMVTGTDVLVGSLQPDLAAYTPGLMVTVLPSERNVQAAQLDLNGLGARPIVKWGQVPLDSADLQPATPARLVYDGTRFMLLNNAYRPCPSGYSPASALTCIADSVRGVRNFHQAVMACDAIGARMCTFGEWTTACRTKPGFLGTVSSYEWVGDGANSGSDGKMVGAGSNGPTEVTGIACEYGATSGIAAPVRYRCCRSR
ncbi:MAG: hypothetical protein IPH05_06555 [Flavobacteriales bacterium]|jgi:hypothetical protein|nr:hypothetical protein [Flavobacteriales bacterium]MBK6551035.1 hypothetical protein [Flavobacteriales bacterium]MBK6882592.1 hypothetical protein [Flavobacteriales bacterium]MBK7101176.1 hypothetical protein [Flavobacteriales bacterium]MBK7111897.1 hypothetical protein [Flavobacteriales bacterium]